MENKIRHMEMIQNIINRMASNSFAIKGLTITLVAGIYTLSYDNTDKLYFFVTYIPILIFWGLDSYYLLQERLYRSLYNKVRKMKECDVDFSMDVSDMKTITPNNIMACLISPTELFFYLPLALLTLIVMIITNI